MRLNQLDEVATELDPDSKYGPITTKAVRQFQAAHPPLKATGAADAATQAAIAEAVTEPQDATDVARKIFALGATAYAQKKFGHAYAYFTRAGELADRPGIVFSRAQALARAGAAPAGGREDEAAALYQQYVSTGEGDRMHDAEQMLELLRAHGAAP